MTLETEKVVKNLSLWQMPYFVIVRRGIAQIKFITETECVLYFGYCERKHGTEWFEWTEIPERDFLLGLTFHSQYLRKKK